MNYRKIYEADAQQGAQQQQGFSAEQLIEYSCNLNDALDSVYNSMEVLTYVKAHYLNKGAGASNVQVATQNMANVAQGNQDTTQADLQEVETTFKKYEDISTKLLQQTDEFVKIMQNVTKLEVEEDKKATITFNSQILPAWKGAFQNKIQRFHNDNIFKGQVQNQQPEQQQIQQQQNQQPEQNTQGQLPAPQQNSVNTFQSYSGAGRGPGAPTMQQ